MFPDYKRHIAYQTLRFVLVTTLQTAPTGVLYGISVAWRFFDKYEWINKKLLLKKTIARMTLSIIHACLRNYGWKNIHHEFDLSYVSSRNTRSLLCVTRRSVYIGNWTPSFANGHIMLNTPVLVRSPKLSSIERG